MFNQGHNTVLHLRIHHTLSALPLRTSTNLPITLFLFTVPSHLTITTITTNNNINNDYNNNNINNNNYNKHNKHNNYYWGFKKGFQ